MLFRYRLAKRSFVGVLPACCGSDRLEDDLKQSSLLQFEGSRVEAQVIYTRTSLSAILFMLSRFRSEYEAAKCA
jgi:hypothetical protein